MKVKQGEVAPRGVEPKRTDQDYGVEPNTQGRDRLLLYPVNPVS